MSDAKTASALFKAAKAGDVPKLLSLLDGGASIEATDPNRLTPVMLAAQAGKADGFRTLVARGANLLWMGLGDTDLLECAAEGGDVEIIRFLLQQGHPVDGRWKPRSKVDERGGHQTPLMLAAINGHVEAVRLLLEAGANREAKFDGDASLKLVQESIRHPLGDDDVALVPRLKEIAALLSAAPRAGGEERESPEAEIGRFAANAKSPGRIRLRASLEERLGAAQPWKPAPDHGVAAKGVVAFPSARLTKAKDVIALQQEARDADCMLLLADVWAPGEVAPLVLFPTADKLAVVAQVGTEGDNHGVRNADILEFLAGLDSGTPFQLTACSHEMVGGSFVGPVKKALEVAQGMAEICPEILDDDIDSVEVLAMALKKSKSFFLRWS